MVFLEAKKYLKQVITLCIALTFFHSYSQTIPSDISNLLAWYKADDGMLTAGSVIQWNDLSGNNFDLSQSSGGSQPTFVENVIGNKPIVRFDGDDFMQTVFGSSRDNPGTVFVLYNITSGSNQYVFDGISQFNALRVRNGNTVQGLIDGTPMAYSKTYPFGFILNSFLIDGSNSKLRENSIDQTTGTLPNNTFDGITLGSYFLGVANMQGDIAEFIYYDRALTSAEIDSVEHYIYNKYAPPVNLGPNISQYGYCDTTLYPEGYFTSYIWSDGSTADSLIVSESGTYWVETTDIFGFTSRDTVEVIYPSFNYPNLQTYCPSDSITWYTNLGPDYNYLWSDGSIADSISIDTPGDYHVEITDTNGCVFQSDTLTFAPDPFESIVTLGPDQNLCSGNTLNLQDGDSLAVDYLWNTSSTDSVITLNSSGTYYVDVVNANGCEASDTIDITIIGDAPNVSIGAPSVVCEGAEFSFEDLSNTTDGSTIDTWSWDLDDGTLITAEDSSHIYTSSGTFDLSLSISTSAGCSNNSSLQIEVLPKPDITFVSANECQNNIIQFNAGQLSPTTISSWEWNFDDPVSGPNNTETGQNVTHVFDSAGDFDVMLVGTDINGCIDTSIITKTVLPTPMVDFDFEEVCEGNVVSFENQSTIQVPGLISSYNWSFGDGTTSGQTDPEKPYIASGNYTVNLIATGNNGCTDQLTQNIKVHAIPVVDQSVESSCAGISTSFIDNSFVSDGSVAQVDWSVNSGPPFSGFSVDEVFEESGTISVEQTVVSAFGCSNSATFNVVIDDFIDAAFDFSPNAFIAGAPISFNSTSQGADNHEWTFESIGSSILPDTTVVFPTSLIGDTLDVELAIENSFGCRDSISVSLPVLERSTDLLLDELFLQESNGFYTVGVRLANLGTTPINEVDLFLNSPSTPAIKETWNGNLQASETTIYVFQSSPSSIVPLEDTNQNYLCVRGSIIQPDLFVESNLGNNKVCNLIEPSESVILSPQPNPIGDAYSIQVILSSSDQGTLKVFDAQGRVVDIIIEDQNLEEGLNTFEVDASKYANGSYTIRYLSSQHSETAKIIKQ